MTFLILLFAHLLADYPLQGEFLSKMKGKNIFLLFVHAGIWTGCIAIAGYFVGFEIDYFDILLLFSVHAIADYVKANNKLWYKHFEPLQGALLIDQLIHIVQIILFIVMNT